MKKVLCVLSICFLIMTSAGYGLAEGPKHPGDKDKCPVCGMAVKPYPNWVAEIEFTDGSYAFFDGPKDMFRYYFNLSKYGKDKSQIKALYVTEYYTTKLIRADEEDLYFIVGSDVMGPMGAELIPVKGKANAETFMKDHKGRKMIRFSEVTPADLPVMKHHKMKGMKGM